MRMSLSQNLAASSPKLASWGLDEHVTAASALFFFIRTVYFSEISFLCLQSVFETKIQILQSSSVLSKLYSLF